MRSPFRSFASYAVSAVLSLAAIVTILLGYNFLGAEYAKYEMLEHEQSALGNVKGQLESIRDKVAKELPSRIPQPGTPADMLAQRIKTLELEISNKQVSRQRLWDDHPIERFLPTSDIFREIGRLDIEIAFLQQGLAYVRNLHTATTGPAETERQIKRFQTSSSNLAQQIYQNKMNQWALSKQAPLMWQVPFSDAYDQMKQWEDAERLLQSSKDRQDAEIVRQQGILQALQKLPRPGPLVLDYGSANRTIQPVSERLHENDKQLDGSNIHKFMRPVKDVLPTALWILVLALLSPLFVKAIAYHFIAPVAVRRPPIRLLPDSSVLPAA